MNEYIFKLAALPWPRVAVVAIIATALYWQFGLEDGVSESQFAAAEAKRTQARTSLEAAQKAVADLKKFREELDLMASQFQQVVELMPSEANVADFMIQIREEATDAGARVKKLEPTTNVARIDFYETRKLDISLEGSYTQILTFLSNLSKLKRLVTVEKLDLSRVIAKSSGNNSEDNANVAFTGTLVSYRYMAQSTATAQPTPAPQKGRR